MSGVWVKIHSDDAGSGGKGGAAYAAGNAGQTGIVMVRVEV